MNNLAYDTDPGKIELIEGGDKAFPRTTLLKAVSESSISGAPISSASIEMATTRRGYGSRGNVFSTALLELSANRFDTLDLYVKNLLRIGAQALGLLQIGLWLFDDQRQHLELYASLDDGANQLIGSEAISVAANTGYFLALERCAVLAVESALDDPRPSAAGFDSYVVSRGTRSVLHVPIRAFGNFAGVLLLDHVGTPRQWMEEEQIFAVSLGANVSLAIERKDHRQAIGEQSRADRYDSLTELANRAFLLERLGQAMARPDGCQSALVLVEMDRFHLINEGLGRDIGDAVLCQFARRLQGAAPHAQTIARLGGDEFAILLNLSDMSAMKCAEQINNCLLAPFAMGDRQVMLSASIGIVSNASGYTRPEAVIRDAEVALNRARSRGRDAIEIFSPAMIYASLRRLNLESELNEALRREELLYNYQPIFDLRTGQLSACEALLRWQHPRRGLLAPNHFIEVTEENGLLPELGWSLLPGALSQLRVWRESGHAHRNLAVNLNITGQQLLQSNFADRLHQELVRHGLPPSAVRVEVTENTLISGQTHLIASLKQVAELGIEIQLDDFGTGFASLRHLSELPLSAVKIDRSFVTSLFAGNRNVRLVESLIAMSHGLGLRVIAEGIESEDQLDLLSSLGCDCVQGFLFGRPMDTARFGKRLNKLVNKWAPEVPRGAHTAAAENSSASRRVEPMSAAFLRSTF